MLRLCRLEDLAVPLLHFARRVGPGLLWSTMRLLCRINILLPKEFFGRLNIDIGKRQSLVLRIGVISQEDYHPCMSLNPFKSTIRSQAYFLFFVYAIVILKLK